MTTESVGPASTPRAIFSLPFAEDDSILARKSTIIRLYEDVRDLYELGGELRQEVSDLKARISVCESSVQACDFSVAKEAFKETKESAEEPKKDKEIDRRAVLESKIEQLAEAINFLKKETKITAATISAIPEEKEELYSWLDDKVSKELAPELPPSSTKDTETLIAKVEFENIVQLKFSNIEKHLITYRDGLTKLIYKRQMALKELQNEYVKNFSKTGTFIAKIARSLGSNLTIRLTHHLLATYAAVRENYRDKEAAEKKQSASLEEKRESSAFKKRRKARSALKDLTNASSASNTSQQSSSKPAGAQKAEELDFYS